MMRVCECDCLCEYLCVSVHVCLYLFTFVNILCTNLLYGSSNEINKVSHSSNRNPKDGH